MGNRLVILLIMACFWIPVTEVAHSQSEKPTTAGEASGEAMDIVRHHQIQLEGGVLKYTSEVAETQIGDSEKSRASFFSISYFKDEVEDLDQRPITFLFNGGPGSSSVWLHLGAFGPRRIDISSDPVHPGVPPYGLKDNPYTLLRFTDLVFVDPVGTGYSRALGEGKDADYWGVDQDTRSVASFIREYLSKHRRWNSPKFLAGESYGTIRAAALIGQLQLSLLDSVTFNGVILVSTALDAQTFLSGAPGNELPYATSLPTFAATAYYHDVLPEKPADLGAFLKEVEEFASTDYLSALFKGDSLSDEVKRYVAEKLHYYTGLPVDYILKSHLRVEAARFAKELLRERGEALAEHDTRFVGKDLDPVSDTVSIDPFLFNIGGPFSAAINSYLPKELGVETERRYKVFSLEANQAWKRPAGQERVFSGFLYTTSYLTAAASTNPHFRVFAASGLHDLTTAFFATQYVFDHSDIDSGQLTLKTYEGGHMMYLYQPSLRQLCADIGDFIEGKGPGNR